MVEPLDPPEEIPGLLQTLWLNPTTSAEFEAEVSVTPTSSGALLVHAKGRTGVTLLSADLSVQRTIEVPELCEAKAMALCDERGLLALPGRGAVRVFSLAGDLLWSLDYRNPARESAWTTCHFSGDGRLLWVLVPNGEPYETGDTLLVLDSVTGSVLGREEIQECLDGGPAWSIHGPHPLLPGVFLEGGMGQDGTISLFATLGGGELNLSGLRESVSFAAYDDTAGQGHATLSHYENRLEWWQTSPLRRLAVQDLDPLFEALEDGHSWEAVFVAKGVLLLPTSEGRLLVVQRENPLVIELRLQGDERNWDWSKVLVLGDKLVTLRHGDQALAAWDLTPLLASPRSSPHNQARGRS